MVTTIVTATVIAAAPAQAGMDSSYVSSSLNVTVTASDLGDVVVGIDGRLKVPGR